MQFNNQKYKINKLKNQQNINDKDLNNLDNPLFTITPTQTFYKTSKPIYDSDWFVPTIEEFPQAITNVKYTPLPQKALYNVSFDLDIAEQFLPYIQIEVLARTPPSMTIRGVYSFIGSYHKEINFHNYSWLGIGQMSLSGCGDTPQPLEAYDLIPADPINEVAPYWLFHYPFTISVPNGTDSSHVLPVAKDYIYPTQLEYLICGGYPLPSAFNLGYSSWNSEGFYEFYEVVNGQPGSTQAEKLQNAKDMLEAFDNMAYSDELPNFKGHVATVGDLPLTGNQENDFYIQDDVSIYRVWDSEESSGTIDKWISAGASVYKAYQILSEKQVVTAKQVKKFTKLKEGKYNIELDGYVLLISEANVKTDFSDLLIPSYKPQAEDLELKIKMYITNPNYYSELKKY